MDDSLRTLRAVVLTAFSRCMRISDFDYDLPAELIARHPSAQRATSRLLHLDGGSGTLHDRLFTDLPLLLSAGDVVVLNNTRVIKARLRAHKPSGGRVEILVERIVGRDAVLAQLRASKTPAAGAQLKIDGGPEVEVSGREGDFFRLRFLGEHEVLSVLETCGDVPLPPYLERAPEAADEERYQTVFAAAPGAVAAPTAGLHFDASMLQRLRECGVVLAYLTLHVGAGTFQPVRAEDITEHRMHSEWYSIPQASVDAIERARGAGRAVLAVGTTTLRALESAAAAGPLRAQQGETRLFIYPGYRFRMVDRLLTNFHLPRSTLLMLVSAFAGVENSRRAYRHAIERRYRFFSYGDAMLIERAPHA